MIWSTYSKVHCIDPKHSMKMGQGNIVNWFSILLGGVNSISASVSGRDVYRGLKFEGGVHRVQRIPKTETKGRTHTSTITVAILPQPTEVCLSYLYAYT